MRLAFDRKESVESLGAGDGSRKLTTQMSQWSSGNAPFASSYLPRERERDGAALN